MAILGEVYELDTASVPRSVIMKLRSRVDEKLEAVKFDCSLCGAEREAKVIDPGSLLIRDYTCTDAMRDCETPPRPKARKSPVFLVPGSLVSCRLSTDDPMRWPGIIEDCPDGMEPYIISGKTPNTVKAYFVTFIFPKSCNRKWVGGFIAAKEVFPFEKHEPPPTTTNTYRKSVEIANKAISHNLGRRLIELSFVAHVANLRNISINELESTFRDWLVRKQESSPTRGTEGESPSNRSAQKLRKTSRLALECPRVAARRQPTFGASGVRRKRLFIIRKVLLPQGEISD